MFKKLPLYNKALIALTMALIYFLNSWFGVEIPLDEGTVAAIWMFLTAFLVERIPNKSPDV